MQAELWTISGLSVELARDRRALAKALENLSPDGEERDRSGRVTRRYRMARVIGHLYESQTASEYDDQRQRLAAAQAEKVEHENAVRRGELARMGDVVRFWTDCIANARAKALAMASKLSPQLVNIGDASIIAAAVRAEVYAFLAELADYDPRERGGVDSPGEPDVVAAAGADGEPVGRPRKAPKQRKQRRAGAVADG